ncbi:MAG: hypothetical protein ACYCW6_04835 [Candidatus Xenobia bacterium]
MKRYLSVLFCMLLMGAALAQTPSPSASASPTASAASQPSSIFDFKDEIGLKPDQVKAIKTEANKLIAYLNSQQGKLQTEQMELVKLIQTKGPMDKIHTHLLAIANMRVDMQMHDIETGRRINKIMTPEQLKKWHAIQARLYHQSPPPTPSP